MKKIDILLEVNNMLNDDMEWIVEEAERLLLSGGVETLADSEYLVPAKVIYLVALNNLIQNRMPKSKAILKKIENLKCF